MDIPKGALYLGGTVDPARHERTGEPVLYEAANLTTHGVIVGMTGSGKTGLGVCLLEEALLQGIPTLVIDPKGDMGNLCLTFPALAPADFEPWIDPTAAERDGQSVAEAAAAAAQRWADGIAGWDMGPDRIAALKAAADVTIYTPGSQVGVGLNILGSLDAPAGETDAETLNDEVEGIATSLLGLIGIAADPLASREHILIANLIHHAWANGETVDLASLIGRIQQPPMRKLGVIDLDAFFPAEDRLALALKLNGLAASPAFAAWMTGEPLDIGRLLYGADGRARCAVVSLAHLGDEERQFVVTLLLGKLVTWMRAQPGTAELRALVYMDEVFGFVPPTAAPPAKKPILTIFKQARAFGVGMVLSTQNPVDIDYKAISNAGTWMVGRLQTEQDKARLLDGMTSAAGGVDTGALSETIANLAKREFLLHSAKAAGPQVFTTRWALNYLPGPLSREQIATLMLDRQARPPAAANPTGETPAAPAAAPPMADDETPTAPAVADGVRVVYLDPAAPWAPTVGAASAGTRLAAGLVARVRLLFDDTSADLRHEAAWEAVWFPLTVPLDTAALHEVDHDERDLRTDAPAGARYALAAVPIDTKAFFADAKRLLEDHLFRTETLTLLQNPDLKLASRVGESREDFAARCHAAADERTDAEADKLRSSLETRIERARDAITKAEDKLREAQTEASSRGKEEILSGVGSILGGLLGGRKSARSILSGIGSKRRMKQNAEERVASAENRLTEEVDELEELETQLAEQLQDIQDAWDAKAANITALDVALEKADIRVEDLALLWVPQA
jgi:hypothetical protein